MPHPILCENNQIRGEHHDGHEVKMRLMVGYDKRRCLKTLSMRIVICEGGSWHMIDDKACFPLKYAMIYLLMFFCRSTNCDEEESSYRHIYCQEDEITKRENAVCSLSDDIKQPPHIYHFVIILNQSLG